LNCERRFENPLENLFMTKLQSLLDGRIRIQSSQACVLVPATG